MSLNFSQFPVPTSTPAPSDKVVGYQIVGGVPILAQYTFTQVSAAIGATFPAASFAALMLAFFNALPTSLPATPGVLWNNGGTLAQS